MEGQSQLTANIWSGYMEHTERLRARVRLLRSRLCRGNLWENDKGPPAAENEAGTILIERRVCAGFKGRSNFGGSATVEISLGTALETPCPNTPSD